MDRTKIRYLLLYDDGKGIAFKNHAFFRVDLKDASVELIVRLPEGGLRGVVSNSRLASRLLRMEPRCAEVLDKDRFVICYENKVWLLDAAKKSFSVLRESRVGFSNPLNLCSDGMFVYWGDYGDNAERESVNIYRVDFNLDCKIMYSFPPGHVRHIHNIVWDGLHRRFFVLTGDLEISSGIYVASEDWREVVPFVAGEQKYRAVVGFPHGDGLIYATDAVAEENKIYLLKDGQTEVLADFPGSCIYGAETSDYYVFSSTVEPPEGRGLLNMFTYKLGAGIKDRYAHLITVRKRDLQVRERLKVKKDIWPMKLFQYGTLTFPKGQENSDTLWYNIVACKGDGRVGYFSL